MKHLDWYMTMKKTSDRRNAKYYAARLFSFDLLVQRAEPLKMGILGIHRGYTGMKGGPFRASRFRCELGP